MHRWYHTRTTMMRPCRCFPILTVVLTTLSLQVALIVVSTEAASAPASIHPPTSTGGYNVNLNVNDDASIHIAIAGREEHTRHTIVDNDNNDDDDTDVRSLISNSSDSQDEGDEFINVTVGIVESNHSRIAAMVIAADSIEVLRSQSNIEYVNLSTSTSTSYAFMFVPACSYLPHRVCIEM
jgi:hypothetical protein